MVGFFFVILARKRPASPKAEVLTDNLFIPEIQPPFPCFIGRVLVSSKQNGSEGEASDRNGSVCSVTMKRCCSYTVGVVSILLLLVGISLVLSNVFPRFVHSMVEKVSVNLRYSQSVLVTVSCSINDVLPNKRLVSIIFPSLGVNYCVISYYLLLAAPHRHC